MAPKAPRLPPVRHPRAPKPNLNRAALLAAGAELFAIHGPAAVSIREIAINAGCSHTLIGQQFGSRKGLETAVIEAAIEEFAEFANQLFAGPQISYLALIAWLREHTTTHRLLSRFALGEFEGHSWRSDAPFGDTLVNTLHRTTGTADTPAAQEAKIHEAKIAAFAILAMILGQISMDQFTNAASRTAEIPAPRRDGLLAEAAELIATLPGTGRVDLSPRTPRLIEPAMTPPDLTMIDSRSALVNATIQLYSAHGPAALTTREIADLARVNQGLIYHYFDSREALLDEAITEANAPFMEVLPVDAPLEFQSILRWLSASPTHRMLVRLEANGVPIDKVRTNFPIFDRLLATFPKVPKGSRTSGLTDPRVAVLLGSSMTFGAVLWDETLRDLLGISHEVDLLPALANLVQLFFSLPLS
jgi:AcrR family transcriptional regulator